jgi:hypothetical protein
MFAVATFVLDHLALIVLLDPADGSVRQSIHIEATKGDFSTPPNEKNSVSTIGKGLPS